LQKVISPRFTILNLIFKPLDPLGTTTNVRTKRLSIGEAHDISSVCGKKVRDPVRALRGVWGFCMGAQGAETPNTPVSGPSSTRNVPAAAATSIMCLEVEMCAHPFARFAWGANTVHPRFLNQFSNLGAC
jgi:hypothetical protein